MAANSDMSREERLAAKLRENLRRRKAQARALGGDGTSEAGAGPDREPAAESGPPLSKQAPSR